MLIRPHIMIEGGVMREIEKCDDYFKMVIAKQLNDRYSANEKIIGKCERIFDGFSYEGTLIINKSRKNPQFLHNTYSGREFLSSNDPLIPILAQKDYCERAIKIAQAENKWIERTLKSMPTESVKNIYADDPIRRSLITPVELTDEEYVNQWLARPFVGKPISPDQQQFQTERGDIVRSKSEVLIANQLFHLGIPYRYECPVNLKTFGIVYPDFMLLNTKTRKEYIYEHLGMMDDPHYVENAMKKIRAYEQNGIYIGDKLIVTMETSVTPLNTKVLENMLIGIFA